MNFFTNLGVVSDWELSIFRTIRKETCLDIRDEIEGVLFAPNIIDQIRAKLGINVSNSVTYDVGKILQAIFNI